MHAAEKYRLYVTAIMGSVYIGKPTKKPYVMSEDRRKVPVHEFIEAVLQYTISQLKDGSDTMTITAGDDVVAEIKIIDKSLLEK